MTTTKSLFSALLAATALLGCQEALDQVNPNSPTPDLYYKTGPQLAEGLTTVYGALQGSDLYGREYFWLNDLRSDEMVSGGGQLEIARQQVLSGTLATDNGISLAVWRGWYRVIHRANLVIDKAPGATANLTDALRDRYVAEAKFMRGWAYYELASLWGGVPIYTSYNVVLSYKPRSKAEEVFAQAITDLTEAAAKLPDSYAATDIGRATKWAALTMLGRVYAQTANFAKVKEVLDQVKNSGKFALVDRYEDNMQEEAEYNKESIFEVYFSEAFGTGFHYNGGGSSAVENTIRGQEYAPIAWRNGVPSPQLLSDYESTKTGDEQTDPRYAFTHYEVGDKFNNGTGTITDAAVQGSLNFLNRKVSWKKYTTIYKRASENMSSGINMRVLRYAEVLLLLAEAENELGNSATAIGYLNQVRGRKSVALAPYPTKRFPVNSKDEVFKAMAHEKFVELAGEQVRNRDLVRWRKAGKVGAGKLVGEPLAYFQANKYELLPIPQSEVDNNDQIGPQDQNPGY